MEKKTFTNYSMMLGITDQMSDDRLDEVVIEYEEELKKARSRKNLSDKRCSFFSSNVDGLKRMQKQRYYEKLRENFELKKEHLLLLAKMDFHLWNNGSVFLGVDGKRPFGNSDITGDVARMLGLDYNDLEISDKDYDLVEKFIDELPIALEEIIKNAKP